MGGVEKGWVATSIQLRTFGVTQTPLTSALTTMTNVKKTGQLDRKTNPRARVPMVCTIERTPYRAVMVRPAMRHVRWLFRQQTPLGPREGASASRKRRMRPGG